MEQNQSTTKAKSDISSTTVLNRKQQEQQQPTQVTQHSKKKKSKNKNKKLSSTNTTSEKDDTVVLTDLGSTKEENLMINGKTLSNQLSLKLHIDNQINGLPIMSHSLAQSTENKNKVIHANESFSSLDHGQYEVVNGHSDCGLVKNNDTECTTKSAIVANKKTKRKPNNKKNLPLNITENEPLSCRVLTKPASNVDLQQEIEKELAIQPLNEQELSHTITTGSNGLPLQINSNSDKIQNICILSNTTANQINSKVMSVSEAIIHKPDEQSFIDDKTDTKTDEASSIVTAVVATELQPEVDLANVHIEYKEYESELQMHDIMRLIQAELSEPYSIYTYRYFIYNWPKLCFLASHGNQYVGAIVCKLDMYLHIRRGYIAMLAVRKEYRKLKIGTTLVQKAIEAMLADDADEVVLETEMSNVPALRLYENLGFVRDKRLFRYYLNGVDALRLKLWFR